MAEGLGDQGQEGLAIDGARDADHHVAGGEGLAVRLLDVAQADPIEAVQVAERRAAVAVSAKEMLAEGPPTEAAVAIAHGDALRSALAEQPLDLLLA